jgi:hypothetical protein
MAVFRTSNDLVTEALANLGVLTSGQPIDPEDFAYVNEKLGAIFRKLAALELVVLPDPDTVIPQGVTPFIPGEFFSDLADIVAGECATKFGSTPDMINALVLRGLGGVQGLDVGFGAAAKSIRAMRRGRPTGEILRVDYF